MKLEANDPEGRPLVYSQEFVTSINVQVNEHGVLSWMSSPTTHDIHLEMMVQDECGEKNTEIFTLRHVRCDCQNGGTCFPKLGVPSGQGSYGCTCLSGFTGEFCEVHIDECASHPCVHGHCVDQINKFSCQCSFGHKGVLCDQVLSDGTNVAEMFGEWSDWGPFSNCSRPCDHGFKVRQRVCNNMPCSGDGSEIRECNAFNCAGK